METSLSEMTVVDFNYFVDNAIHNFAKNKVENGDWLEEESLNRSQELFADLLPAGIKPKIITLKKY